MSDDARIGCNICHVAACVGSIATGRHTTQASRLVSLSTLLCSEQRPLSNPRRDAPIIALEPVPPSLPSSYLGDSQAARNPSHGLCIVYSRARRHSRPAHPEPAASSSALHASVVQRDVAVGINRLLRLCAYAGGLCLAQAPTDDDSSDGASALWCCTWTTWQVVVTGFSLSSRATRSSAPIWRSRTRCERCPCYQRGPSSCWCRVTSTRHACQQT